MNKLIVICGPTCTGKASLAIRLCKKPSARGGGEIVSADSRQIYKFMDIGTGKLPLSQVQSSRQKGGQAPFKVQKGDGVWTIDGVHVHLYDVVEPDRKFSVARFKDAATKEIESMWRRKKVPFLVGGTGFYIAAVLGETEFPRIPPDWKLRQELEKLSTEELFEKLQKLDPERAKMIDPKNPHRLIRAIEVALALRAAPSSTRAGPNSSPDSQSSPALNVPANTASSNSQGQSPFASTNVSSGAALRADRVLKVGLTSSRKILYRRADAWAEAIVNDGLINEVQDLINRGYKETPPMKGIIYQVVADHLDGKISGEEMLQRIKLDLHGYIRRQLTWFKRDRNVKWFDITEPDFAKKVEKMVESFLKDG